MSASCDTAGNAIPGSEVGPMRAVRLQGHGTLDFKSNSTLVCDTYGETVDEATRSLLVVRRPVSFSMTAIGT